MNYQIKANDLIKAIREIFLIVISVILAIQLNNWNDKRISIKRSKEHLVGVKRDLGIDTFTFNQIIEFAEQEHQLLSNRLNITDYNSLSLDSLNSFIINSSAMDYRINNQSYQKILNLGLTNISKNVELVNLLEFYYNKLNSRFNTFLEYEHEQTSLERSFWFYNQNIVEVFLSTPDEFPFIQEEKIRKKDLVNLFESVDARNHMRSEYYRKHHLLNFVKFTNDSAKRLIDAIDQEIPED